MTKATLPRVNQTGTNEWSDVEANDNALAEVVNGQLDNENIKAGAGITREKLAADAKGVVGTWCTPKVIATEESRTNTAFATLTTPDEITGVAVPENSSLFVEFSALVKTSIEGAGRVAIFLSGTQLKNVSGSNYEVELATVGATFKKVFTTPTGLSFGGTEFVTTGEVGGQGWLLIHRLAAGTYTVSVQYRATSGSITAKTRTTKAAVFGS